MQRTIVPIESQRQAALRFDALALASKVLGVAHYRAAGIGAKSKSPRLEADCPFRLSGEGRNPDFTLHSVAISR